MVPDAFDRIMATGQAAILAEQHVVERSPADTGRWGTSVVLLPSGPLAATLDTLTAEAAAVAGRHHWHSGTYGAAHVTVRALEHYTSSAPDDETTAHYVGAVERAVAGLGPVPLVFEGLTLSAGTIMACATDPSGTADELRHRLGAELGRHGWLEERVFTSGRDPIWYSSILHFAGGVRAPERLIEWVQARRQLAIGEQAFTSLSVCRWDFEGNAMRPRAIARVPIRQSETGDRAARG